MSSESNKNEPLSSQKTPEKEHHHETASSSIRLPEQQCSPLPGLNRFRTPSKPQSIEDKYLPPENLLEVRIINPETQGFQKDKFTDYEIIVQVSVVLSRG
jgi:hypothetical protein